MATPEAPARRRRLAVEEVARGVAAGDRAVLGRAITLVESHRPDDQEAAQELLARLLPRTGTAARVGITGVPGVGKSTFLESLGGLLTGRGRRVAVLAVDPSSSVSGGSILGDKTRMPKLATDPNAFIRPSPTGGSLGGVARKTRETILLCEAAGYEVIFVETVGVGQSETVVAEMVDSVLLLLLPGAGDELQGLKRGILELVDLIAVNKADGESLLGAKEARAHYRAAMGYLHPAGGLWTPPVQTCSALEGSGLAELWDKLEGHRRVLEQAGALAQRRREQQRCWLWSLVEEGLLASFRGDPRVAAQLPELERRVAAGETTPTAAARRLLAAVQAS